MKTFKVVILICIICAIFQYLANTENPENDDLSAKEATAVKKNLRKSTKKKTS